MPASTSPSVNGYVLDTNVLSLLAKIGRLDLLVQLATVPLYVTPAIQTELEIGFENGVSYLADALQLVATGALPCRTLTPVERLLLRALPTKLAAGEAEAIALCRHNQLTLISHDRKAINYCVLEGIDCIRLTVLVETLENAGLLTKIESQTMFS